MPPTPTDPITVSALEDLARTFARARADLSEKVAALDDEMRTLRRSRIRGIKSTAARAIDAHAALRDAIAAAPHLFAKPRTMTVDGIRFGWTKARDRIEWADDAVVCRRIRRFLPELVETLIKTTDKPVKSAMSNLSASELRKIGCRVVPTNDEVTIKTQDSEIDKLIDRLLAESDEPATHGN